MNASPVSFLAVTATKAINLNQVTEVEKLYDRVTIYFGVVGADGSRKALNLTGSDAKIFLSAFKAHLLNPERF